MGLLVFNRLEALANFRMERRHALIGAVVIALALAAAAAGQLIFSKGYITPAGAPVGGDFAAFWTAAKAMAAGDAAKIYDPAIFENWLFSVGPERERWGLTWQYPPSYFFIIGFLAITPYWLGYALWTGGGIALFAGASRAAGLKGAPWLIMLCAPAIFQAYITGQNGFLTASLLLGATLSPDKRPILAGLCAATLTVKPQLGLLIPIAYIAGGHWRAFTVAATGGVALAGTSLIVFGIHPWTAFFESLVGVSGRVGNGAMPLYKMPTVFATFSLAGFPTPIAAALHLAGAGATAWVTWKIWRTSESRALKAAIVCTGAFLVAPYAYYYELVILAAPIALLATEAAREGWRRYDHLMLIELFLICIFLPGEQTRHGFNLPILVTIVAFLFVLSRLQPAQNERRAFIAAASVPSSR